MQDKDKQVVSLVVFIVIILIDLIFILGWQWRLLSGYYKNAKEKKQSIISLKIDLQNLDNYNKEMSNLDERVTSMKLLIIDEADISALIENISNLADSSGVKVTQIKPVIDSIKPRYIQARDTKFQEIDIKIIAKADYHQFGNFMSRIESAKSFLKLSELEMETDNRNYFTQNIGLTLKTFVKVREQ
ncbi:MAG: type 4a pilus biogenesis protein PilO [Candidatus Omnitrophota bacterium]